MKKEKESVKAMKQLKNGMAKHAMTAIKKVAINTKSLNLKVIKQLILI